MARKSKGRQKVEMKKIKKESNLQVTFSKRHSGLFKKASELCTLCGSEVGIIVFSPGKKIFSFGHPSVETIADRFLNRNPTHWATSSTTDLMELHRNASVRDLNIQLTQKNNQLEMEKKRGEDLSVMRKASQRQCWWENPVEQLDLSQLHQLKASLDDLKKNVDKQADILLTMHNSNHPQFFAPNPNPILNPIPNPNNNGAVNPYWPNMVNPGFGNPPYGFEFNY